MGEGLLVHKALEKQAQGASYDEMVEWIEDFRYHVCHNFTVDDLFHLYRGGRVSKATAIVGSMLNMKPVLHVDDEGKLVAVGKMRGRKRALDDLVKRMGEQIGDYENKTFFISHGDCLADAEYVRDQVKEKFGISDCLINFVGPSIGAHSGPGTIALFFLGKQR